MSRSYPIWVDVNACIYNNSKSYGIKNTGEQTYHVGSSRSNSEKFINTIVTKRKTIIDGIPHIIFRYSVDDVVIKEALFTEKNGRAKDFVRMNYCNNFESLTNRE